MRQPADPSRVRRLLEELGRRALGPGRVYLAGGATALLEGWRASTVDVDLKLDPEPPGIFEAIAALKDELGSATPRSTPLPSSGACAASWKTSMPDLEGLPGAERIARGLLEAGEGRATVDALLVAIASRRLDDLGLPVPNAGALGPDAELALYALLGEVTDDPYNAYNAALADLDSFLSSLEARRRATA